MAVRETARWAARQQSGVATGEALLTEHRLEIRAKFPKR